MRLHDLAFSLANMRVARQVLFQIKLALFDHQQQEVSEIPSNSSECAAEAAARIFRLGFRVAMVNSVSDRVFLAFAFCRKISSISWGHHHMSGKPPKQSNPAVCFYWFAEGKLKAL